MTPEDLGTKLLTYGVECRVRNNEVQVKRCFRCGNDKWNLEINVGSGVYHCWACNSGGRADAAASALTGIKLTFMASHVFEHKVDHVAPSKIDILGPPADEDLDVSEYLEHRGIGVVDQRIYGLRRSKDVPMWKNRVVFPLKEYWSQEIIGYMGRSFLGEIPKYFAWWDGNRKRIVGYHGIYKNIHVIVEGPFDGIKVNKGGYGAAILIGTSGPELEEWVARVDPTHYVVVLLDGDAVSQARRLYWRIYPIHIKTVRITLPETWDPGEMEPKALSNLIRRECDRWKEGGG